MDADLTHEGKAVSAIVPPAQQNDPQNTDPGEDTEFSARFESLPRAP